jgi:glycosyltransferase involved in cell wall biosynthesis
MLLSVVKMYPPEMGGVEVVAKEIAEIGKEYFGESEVITFNKENKLKIENINGVNVYRLKTFFRKDPLRVSSQYKEYLIQISKKSKKIIFHFPAFQPEMFFLINDIKESQKICFYHADIVGRGLFGDVYNNIVVNNYLKKMDKIIVTSPNIIESSKLLKKFKNKIEIVPLFVDIKHFYYRKNNKREELLNKVSKHNKDIKLILYIGRLGRYKGIEYLIEATENLPNNYYTIIIGNGPKEEELKELVNNKNLEKRVFFLNHISYQEMPEYYSAADVFVLPSIDRGEAFGLVAIEAMACGIPVITTELGTGTSYHNIDGITGKIIPPKDSSALKEAILDVTTGDYSKEKIIERAKDFSLEKFKYNIIKILGGKI